jgi:hypothetical protein
VPLANWNPRVGSRVPFTSDSQIARRTRRAGSGGIPYDFAIFEGFDLPELLRATVTFQIYFICKTVEDRVLILLFNLCLARRRRRTNNPSAILDAQTLAMKA